MSVGLLCFLSVGTFMAMLSAIEDLERNWPPTEVPDPVGSVREATSWVLAWPLVLTYHLITGPWDDDQ